VPYDRVEVDGRSPTLNQLESAALVNYGHYSVMQVRNGRVRGLALHLARLEAANQELFDVGLDGDRVRAQLRRALGDDRLDATVRIVVFDGGGGPSILVAVRGPAEVSTRPQRLRVVHHARPIAHLKHVGSFGQLYHGIRAERDGFDDALFADTDGVVSETTIANIGFLDGDAVVWPDAPMLAGITMQLLEPRLRSGRRPIRVADLAALDGAFVCNSLGVAPVGHIDDLALPIGDGRLRRIVDAYEAVPWDPIEE
jgi:branched-subunit amino acid aminotransferase/4-amino-4-deoxychorismate lyase